MCIRDRDHSARIAEAKLGPKVKEAEVLLESKSVENALGVELLTWKDLLCPGSSPNSQVREG
eukprot:3802860-Amphidinium_carterae.1